MPLDPLSVAVGAVVAVVCCALYLRLRARVTPRRAQNGQQGRFRCTVCTIDFDTTEDAKAHALTHNAITERNWADIIDGVD